MTALQQDINDVLEAVENLGDLFLLRCRTVTGRRLRDVVYVAVETRQRVSARALLDLKEAVAEVEGLRAQNARLTEALLAAENR